MCAAVLSAGTRLGTTWAHLPALWITGQLCRIAPQSCPLTDPEKSEKAENEGEYSTAQKLSKM
jgi:hypothetical protein